MTTKFIEGYFIVTYENHIFEIKGDIHPKDRLIAYLRYIPDKNGNRHIGDGRAFRKIYELDERENYLKKYYPHYLQFDQVHGRVLQSVPIEDVALVLNPIDALSQLRDLGRYVSELQYATLELTRYLIQESGIQWSDIGLTGSQLAGLAVSNSDIDLVIYGIKPARGLYTTLKQKFDSLPFIHRYSSERLSKHVNFRWGENNQRWDILRHVESQKVLQGLFESKEFFIRLVKNYDEICHEYGDLVFHNDGMHSVCCEVLDDFDSIFTPCTYIVSCEKIPGLTEFLSYRGRFTEQVSKGMKVEARGRLETVHVQKTGEYYKRLVLGENLTDYLVPI